MFPLIGWDGGVLTRAGHTEAAIDISRLANLDLSAVICEVMKDDGHMARLPDLMTFAEEHNLRIGTIRDLIAYRINHDLVVKEISVNSEFWLSNPITEGFILTLFENSLDGSKHATLHLGNLEKDKSILTRVHPIQSFDDIIFNLDNPKTKDLKSSLEKIKKNGSGMVVLINNPILQGMSNLNLDEELKYYGLGAQMIKHHDINNIIILSNSNYKGIDLSIYGINVTGVEVINNDK
jgi:3,4-dihydroxy 2-butanone 4-phosphate synthase/GTP cyclohydrolase II